MSCAEPRPSGRHRRRRIGRIPSRTRTYSRLRGTLGQSLAFAADASYFEAIAELIEDPATGSARSSLISDYLGEAAGG